MSPSSHVLATRSEKLRKACNNCNVAKVKCSGERTGCDRCNTSSVYCIYEPSRVGKVPGVRAKNRTLQDDERHREVESVAPRPSSKAPETLRRSRVEMALDTPPDSAHSMDAWTTGLGNANQFGPLSPSGINSILDGAFELEHPFTSRPSARRPQNHSLRPSLGSGSQAPSGAETDTQTSDMELDLYSVDNNPFASPRGPADIDCTIDQRPLHTPVEETPVTRSRSVTQPNIDSQCVLACSVIITRLETYIDARIRMLDLTLDIVRKAITSLTSIIDRRPSSRCSHLLLAAIMHQTVQILDYGCTVFLEAKDNASDSGDRNDSQGMGLNQFDTVGGMLSGFGFGGFVMDAGDQRAWRARLALKEVRQVKECLKHVFLLAAQHSTDLPLPAETCNHDMTVKLDRLAAQFEKISNS